MNLKVRIRTCEQLDNLSLSGKALKKTLDSLRFINSVLGNHKQSGNAILNYCKTLSPAKKIHIIDIGCGGGDCIFYISKKLKKNKINASFTGVDGNLHSISYARQNNPDPANINFYCADIIDPGFVLPDCDVLISSHFMYHFSDNELTIFLKKLKSKVNYIIFSELYRSKIAYYTFKGIRFILPISKMAKKDGLIAIQRAFLISELKKIIDDSTITEYSIVKKPFFRIITQITLPNERETIQAFR